MNIQRTIIKMINTVGSISPSEVERVSHGMITVKQARSALHSLHHIGTVIACGNSGDLRKYRLRTGCPDRKIEPCSYYYPLFKHMADAHGLILLDSELEDICQAVWEMQRADTTLAEKA